MTESINSMLFEVQKMKSRPTMNSQAAIFFLDQKVVRKKKLRGRPRLRPPASESLERSVIVAVLFDDPTRMSAIKGRHRGVYPGVQRALSTMRTLCR